MPARPRYALVLFDFDGTLADSFPWFLRTLDGVAERFRFARIEPAEVEVLRTLGGRELVRRLRIPFWKLPLIARHVRRMSPADLASVTLFAGIDTLLGELHEEGVQLGIVSSNAEHNVRSVLGPRLAPLVRYWECGAGIFGKRAAFRRVLRRSGVAPRATLAVGDEIRDHEAARAAGVAFGAVAWGYTDPDALRSRGPDEMFEQVADVRRAVLGTSPPRG